MQHYAQNVSGGRTDLISCSYRLFSHSFYLGFACIFTVNICRCHSAHTREEQGHEDEDVNSNNSL